MSATPTSTRDELDDLFRATILEHSRHPRNRGTGITDPDIAADGANAACGDHVHLRLRLDAAGHIAAIEWDGQGCAISQASISMMTRQMVGKTLPEAARIIAAFRALLRGDPVTPEVNLGESVALAGVRQFPVRMRCALLGWQTLADGINRHQGDR